MASELLLDLSTIDLDQVAISPGEVGRINPQTGSMRQLDHVIVLDLGKREAVGVKEVRDDEFWVPLHIPGRPLLPGVLQIEAAAQLCSVYFHFRMKPDGFVGFTRCDDAVFRKPVVPGDTLYLLVRELRIRKRRILSQAQGVVNGTLVFESKITGMVI